MKRRTIEKTVYFDKCRCYNYKMKLLTRTQFKDQVFARSNGVCVFCDKPAVDAHHILDRKLFADGGYYLDNGAAVCEEHHLQCEFTLISVEKVREACKITHEVLPPEFAAHYVYDKWGNIENFDGTFNPGPLINDDGCLKALKRGGKIGLFNHLGK